MNGLIIINGYNCNKEINITGLDISAQHDEIYAGFDDCLEIMSEEDKKRMRELNWLEYLEDGGWFHFT